MRLCLTGQAEWDYSANPQTATLFSLYCHPLFSLLPHTAQDTAREREKEMSGWKRSEVGVGVNEEKLNGNKKGKNSRNL